MAAHEEWCSLGLPSAAFWRQTPRVNLSALKGAARGERRTLERAALQAQWIGSFAQCHPKHYPGIDKMVGKKVAMPHRHMTGKEIGGAMRAWARRTS